jgi:hypothetical protein
MSTDESGSLRLELSPPQRLGPHMVSEVTIRPRHQGIVFDDLITGLSDIPVNGSACVISSEDQIRFIATVSIKLE